MPSLAGPKRPQDRIDLRDVKKNFLTGLARSAAQSDRQHGRNAAEVQDGSVVIAAITSCTNTSNPSVMLAAGLLAKKAVEKRAEGAAAWVKTSLAPGSKVVMDYYERRRACCRTWRSSNFHLVGFGCTTCIGNSGPLPEAVAEAVHKEQAGRRGGAQRQSQLRRPHQSAGARQLSGVAAAGGGLRHRRAVSISTCRRSRSARTRRARRSTCKISGRRRKR